jgi:hypothetical protein
MKFKSLVVLVLLILYVKPGLSQKLITARVVDSETNQPIDKAVIFKEGDSLKTATNYLGYFQLAVDSSDYLIIEKDGYQTSKINIPPQNGFLIKIEPTKISNATEVLNEYEKGKILDGYKTGIWEYYDKPGEVALSVDYDNGQILFLKPDTSKYAIQFKKEEYMMMEVDRPARYIGSIRELYEIVNTNVRFPAQARRNSTVGSFHIIFEVDNTGQAHNFRAINDIGDGCGEAIIESLKLVPNLWLPALIDGKSYNSRFSIPITFKIELDGKQIGRPKKLKKENLPIAKSLSEIVVTAVGVSRK